MELTLLQKQCLLEAIEDYIDKMYELYNAKKEEIYLKSMQASYNLLKQMKDEQENG